MDDDDAKKRSRLAGWMLGLSICATALAFITPWAFVIQIVLLVFALYQLLDRPQPTEAALLLITLGILVLALVWVTTSIFTHYLLTGTTGITAAVRAGR